MDKESLVPYIEKEIDDVLTQGKDLILCFVEGKPDVTFYSNYINQHYSEFNVFFFNCQSFKNVINIFEILKKKKWKKKKESNFLFFTDKDFSDIDFFSENRIVSDNIFRTDFYSFENYIVNEQTLRRILIECLQDKNHVLHLEMYSKLYKEFSEAFKKINYLVLYLRIMAKEKSIPPIISWKHQTVVKFLEKYFEISENLEIKIKSFQELIDFDQIQREFKNLKIDATIINFQYIEMELIKRIDNLSSILSKKIFNGHNEIIFMMKYLSKIHSNIKAPQSDSYISNEYLFILIASPRTEIPINLQKFLKINYNKLKEA